MSIESKLDEMASLAFTKLLIETGFYDTQPNGELIKELMYYIDDYDKRYNELHDLYLRERCTRCM